jgi:hypothetical protein
MLGVSTGALPRWTSFLDEAEHFRHNRDASVATLRWCLGSSRNAVRNHPGFSVRLRRNPQQPWRRLLRYGRPNSSDNSRANNDHDRRQGSTCHEGKPLGVSAVAINTKPNALDIVMNRLNVIAAGNSLPLTIKPTIPPINIGLTRRSTRVAYTNQKTGALT